MLGMIFEFSANTLEKISADIALVFAFAQEKENKGSYLPFSSFSSLDTTLKGQVSKAATVEKFKGERGEVLRIIPQNVVAPGQVIVLGLGKEKEVTPDDVRRIVSSFIRKVKRKVDSVALALPNKDELAIDEEKLLHVLVEGLSLGTYEFAKYKTKKKEEKEVSTVIFAEINKEKQTSIKAIVEKAELYYQGTKLARDLVNETPTIATPTYLADLATHIAKSNPQISCKVFDRKQAEKMGMEAFLGIARAAATEPKFIHLEYTPKKAGSKEKLAIIGKGITFDSGGINVKPGDYMQDMKMDMAGAATVLGIFSVIAKIQPDYPVVGLIAATPNLISGTSLVPGDVVRASNGKTIEVLNTDAEGRVTMADSLSYAVKQGATRIIDFATLTGACMVALGTDIAGLFANNAELAAQIKQAADMSGEKVWELPLEKEYKKLNKSEVADISNIGSSRYGGALTAALFLQEFVDNTPWAHLDIAGPAFLNAANEVSPKGGSGFGVRLMLNLLSK